MRLPPELSRFESEWRTIFEVAKWRPRLPMAERRFASQSGSAVASGFSKTRICPLACVDPRLFPAPYPRFVGEVTRRTFGNEDRTNSAVPSVDALSTTIISKSRNVCRDSALRQAATYARALKVTTITEANGLERTRDKISRGQLFAPDVLEEHEPNRVQHYAGKCREDTND